MAGKQLIAKSSYRVFDPKTGKSHDILKGESRTSSENVVKLAPWAFVTPESLATPPPPVHTAKPTEDNDE